MGGSGRPPASGSGEATTTGKVYGYAACAVADCTVVSRKGTPLVAAGPAPKAGSSPWCGDKASYI